MSNNEFNGQSSLGVQTLYNVNLLGCNIQANNSQAFTSLSTTNLITTNMTANNFILQSLTTTNLNLTNITSTNINSTNITSTNLIGTNGVYTSITSTNLLTTMLKAPGIVQDGIQKSYQATIDYSSTNPNVFLIQLNVSYTSFMGTIICLASVDSNPALCASLKFDYITATGGTGHLDIPAIYNQSSAGNSLAFNNTVSGNTAQTLTFTGISNSTTGNISYYFYMTGLGNSNMANIQVDGNTFGNFNY
jgi:hypothetical protein